MIYLDNNATTPVLPEISRIIAKSLSSNYANPSSLHSYGVSAGEEVLSVRKKIGDKLGCRADEIIFTASGSESNNLLIKGAVFANSSKGRHLITSSIEHPSVLNTFAFLERQGFSVSYLEVDEEGVVQPEVLKNAITNETILISIAHVNNEIGTIQPIEELSEISGDILFHTDAVQSFLKVDLNFSTSNIDMASFSGHKIHAPKGIGFAYCKKSIVLEPLIHGGQQEYGLRAGTENLPYILALGYAVDDTRDEHVAHMKFLQQYVMRKLKAMPGIRINGPQDLDQRVCSNINFASYSLEGEVILRKLSQKNIFVSTGSACSSKYSRVSHVLQAINCPQRYIHGNVRLGISRYTTIDELNTFLDEFESMLGATSNSQFGIMSVVPA